MSKTLTLNNIHFDYREAPKNPLICGISMEFTENKIHIILGPSGSGKTTLLNLIAKVLNPSSGKISYKENDEVIDYSVGYVFQEHTLIPWRTVKDNILLGAEIKGNITEELKDSASDIINEFGLAGYENSYPSELSGGMKQRVSILRTMISDAKILLLDEPFVSLDSKLKRELQDELSEIVEKKQLIAIMVTHDWFETIKLANSINIFSSKPLRLMSRTDVTESREHRKNLKISEFSEYAKYLNEIDGLTS